MRRAASQARARGADADGLDRKRERGSAQVTCACDADATPAAGSWKHNCEAVRPEEAARRRVNGVASLPCAAARPCHFAVARCRRCKSSSDEDVTIRVTNFNKEK